MFAMSLTVSSASAHPASCGENASGTGMTCSHNGGIYAIWLDDAGNPIGGQRVYTSDDTPIPFLTGVASDWLFNCTIAGSWPPSTDCYVAP